MKPPKSEPRDPKNPTGNGELAKRRSGGPTSWPARRFSVSPFLRFSLLLWLSTLILQPSICLAQTYSIDWFTLDGGGGTSTGGVYSVSGTVGQPDAGPLMTGGNYALQGGFWAIQAVQTPGAPTLTITRTTTNTVAVSWPSPSTGWVLQQNTNNVSSVNWSNVTATIQDDGTTKTLIVNPPTGNRFYRLLKP